MKAVVVLLLLAWLTGCAGDGSDSDPYVGTEPTVTSSETPSETSSETPSSSGTSKPSPVVAAAVRDLAQRHDVDPAEVTVVSREEVTWRNGSRGCAEPGMSYTQALIDGSRITLRLDGKDYEYHSGGSGPVFLCERPTE